MPSYYDSQHLHRELESESAKTHLGALKRHHPSLERHATWRALIKTMHDPSVDPKTKDNVLAILVGAQQEGPHPILGAALLLVFHPGLCRLLGRHRPSDPDAHEVWGEIHLGFLEAVQAVDVDLHAGRIARAIIRSTHNRVKLTFDRRFAFDRRRREHDFDLDERPSAAADRAMDEVERRDVFETYARLFRAACDAGVIDTDELHLVAGTIIYDRPLADYARKNGGNYEALKKRRQRALRAFRAWRKH